MTSETTASWQGIQRSECTGDYLLLILNHSMTGLLEITVTFSSGDCEKSSITTEYFGKMAKYNYVKYSLISIQWKVC